MWAFHRADLWGSEPDPHLCNSKSSEIARRLEKLACVKIPDTDRLKSIIDKQLGVEGIAKPCEYTSGYERDHFLKSVADGWQDEFRIFWPYGRGPVTVDLPTGIAEKIEI